jgi:hypothetical protein
MYRPEKLFFVWHMFSFVISPTSGYAVFTFPLLISQFLAVLSGQQFHTYSQKTALSRDLGGMTSNPTRDFARYCGVFSNGTGEVGQGI